MDHLMSDNYRLRQYFLETQEVPSQSMMKKKMSEPLAALYFDSMTPNLKVIAGLEPLLKGGGGDWYAPPEELLKGRTVLKPLKKEYLSKLNYLGIEEICMKLLEHRRKSMKLEKNKMLSVNDKKWRRLIEDKCEQIFNDCAAKESIKNSLKIRAYCDEFASLYSVAITNVENVMFDATTSEINRIKNEAFQKMQDKYQTLVKNQATELYDIFTNRLEIEKLKIRGEFVETLARDREKLRDSLHDLNVEKHLNIEQGRQFWECRRLACQVYVALKEQEECKKDIELSDHIHKKKVKFLSAEIAKKEYEITGRGLKEKLQLEFESVWQKKVWHVLNYFRMYVSYCLSLMPDQADFFINMEKLMLLQLDEALENPSAESIFEVKESYEGPSPGVHPFYLFCDKSRKKDEPHLDRDLCPKRCTSSASQMPVIVVNKRCIYAACDNFEQFTDKVKQYIHGERGDDADFIDNHVYEYDVPVKYTPSQYLSELKLESSLLQLLRQEVTNTGDTTMLCSACKLPYCYCKNRATASDSFIKTENKQNVSRQTSSWNISKTTREDHTREPRIETYLKSIKPKRCTCSKTSKKHLEDHLPVYMKKQGVFDGPAHLPNYETCSFDTLKKLVKTARGRIDSPIETKGPARTRDVATQYKDEQYEELCTCFSDDMILMNDLMKTQSTEVSKYYRPSTTATDFDFLDNYSSPTPDSDFSSDSSAQDRARERAVEKMRQRARLLRASVSAVPELAEIFKIVRDDGAATQRLPAVPKKLYSRKSIIVREQSTRF
ncbi:hypothetical protein PYW08_005807 [Mythimna loreyi]|uniref:Uncharacterized protein n=1 Tax=Mythimna loreyi TaxID=667449 RepID=A0ACC2QHK7_9NEOP|nr:hypothetical protein PYW08_005807 [Mythimna loreyi]